METVFVLNNDQMGQGDQTLGHKLLQACLRRLADFQNLEAIVLYNSGVKLGVKGSPVAPELTTLQERGVEVLVCGTCVDHYGLADELMFEQVSNMDEIVATLAEARKVITL